MPSAAGKEKKEKDISLFLSPIPIPLFLFFSLEHRQRLSFYFLSITAISLYHQGIAPPFTH